MRLFGHPAHATLAHFPLVLCSTSVLWDVVALWDAGPWWPHLAFWSIVLGLIMALPATITGLVDFARLPRDAPAEVTGFRHLWLVSLALCLYLGALVVRGGAIPASSERLWCALGLCGTATLCILTGAWHGGELVFRYGVGQPRSLDQPKPLADAASERRST